MATLLDQIRAAGLTLEPVPGGNLRVTPKDRLTDVLRRKIVAHKTELLAALTPPGATVASPPAAQTAEAQAWQAAQDAIDRARQHCTACDHWRSDQSRPVCHKGHALCWRLLNPGKRTTPSRRDAQPCPDKTPE